MTKAKIAIISFASPLHGEAQLTESHQELLEALYREFEIVSSQPGEAAEADLRIVFIASGGIEQKFLAVADQLPRPLILLADGKHNSLAASLEIMSRLRRNDDATKLLHGDPPHVCAELRELVRFERARLSLAGRIGVIGAPSDWLIGSEVDYKAAARRWGSTFCEIDIDELVRQAAIVSEEESGAIARRFIAAARSVGVAEPEIAAAARLYPALKAIFTKHRLRAATVRCFSLLESLKTTGCLALSMLSDEGAICGCEGDVAALFSMLLLHDLTGEPPFMANPARIDSAANEVILAHCTTPTRSTRGYDIRTHFESGIGVGIAGELPLGPATLFKVGGPGLSEFFVSAAEVLEHSNEEGMCRTQARVRLSDEAIDYFFRAPLANHHVLISGDYAGLVRRFMDYSER